jgi:hypothetical protein
MPRSVSGNSRAQRGWAAKKAPESRAVAALHVEIGRASVFSRAAACRANAKQCLSSAELASDPDNREAFFDLAAIWVSVAARIEHAARIEKSTAVPGIRATDEPPLRRAAAG